MKILCIIPPYIPSYFNAGHHLAVFQVGAYLREYIPNAEVDCYDGAALNMHWRNVCDLLLCEYDYICVLNDFDAVDTFERFVKYARELSPRSKLLTFGRLSKIKPQVFKNFCFDGIVYSGDNETGVANYIRYHSELQNRVPGVFYKEGEKYIDGGEGEYSPVGDWVLPDVSEIPYDAYSGMYANDLNKFCGIPNSAELVVPAARGCPVGCSFCDVPLVQGKKDRRMSVDSVLEYIDRCEARRAFDYVAFYAPTFTLNRKWMLELCSKLALRDRIIPWKCATTVYHLDKDLLDKMAASGCVRVSVGIEALDPIGQAGLPRIKRDNSRDFSNLVQWCADSSIELNCFVILGLPDGSPDGVEYTVGKVLQAGARVRPTLYTPYELMASNADASEVSDYNRQIFSEKLKLDRKTKDFYYGLFYRNELDQATTVEEKLAKFCSVQ